MSSPNSPSPRLNARTSFPFSYRKLAETPSIFNSAQYSTFCKAAAGKTSTKLFLTLSSNSLTSSALNAFFKLCIGDKCLYFLYSKDVEDEFDKDDEDANLPLPTRAYIPSSNFPRNSSNFLSTASNFILNKSYSPSVSVSFASS